MRRIYADLRWFFDLAVLLGYLFLLGFVAGRLREGWEEVVG
jgi:hypothetical protein